MLLEWADKNVTPIDIITVYRIGVEHSETRKDDVLSEIKWMLSLLPKLFMEGIYQSSLLM